MKFSTLIILVVLTIFAGLEAKKSSKMMYFTSSEVAFNPLYLQDHRLLIKNTTLDVVLNVAQNYPRDPWILAVIGIANGKSPTYRTLFEYNVNVCSLLGTGGANFIKIWIDNFLKYGNLPKSCPILKGNYSWYNLKVDKFSLPDFMPTSRYRGQVDTYFLKNKDRESVANVTLFFELK